MKPLAILFLAAGMVAQTAKPTSQPEMGCYIDGHDATIPGDTEKTCHIVEGFWRAKTPTQQQVGLSEADIIAIAVMKIKIVSTCAARGWPSTPTCEGAALAVAKSLTDTQLVPKPSPQSGGAK